LVLKEEIDLLEVPLFEVISAYLEEMEDAGVVGYWDEMTEFLLLMSLLVEVKSRLLLPGAPVGVEDELTPEAARDQFLARLFEYSRFKAASLWLRATGEANVGCVLRAPAAHKRRRLGPVEELVGSEDAMVLRERLAYILESKSPPDTSHLAQIKVELQRQIRIVRGIVARHRRFSFNRIFGAEPPLVQALSVFALLDLLARGEIRATQRELFGDIVVTAADARKSA
jgi:segregation and condensation protein A